MEIIELNKEQTFLQRVADPLLLSRGINLFIKREDLIHPTISGNKWYKLKYNLIQARGDGYETLLSFGGAYSNHIYALAAAGKIFGFKTIGIIRGEEHLPLNPTLSFAVRNGMEIFYLSRSEYRRKNTSDVIDHLKEKYRKFYLIPEGGSNSLAVKGCAEIMNSIDIPFNYVCVPCGTGGTISGIISSLDDDKTALGFAVLKGAEFLNDNVFQLLPNSSKSNWKIILDYHFGGYAKFNNQLLEFINKFESATKIPLEPIYTGKMMYGIYDLALKSFFKKDDIIIAVHTGGLQGIQGLEKISKNNPQ